jgi:hypothetical protein
MELLELFRLSSWKTGELAKIQFEDALHSKFELKRAKSESAERTREGGLLRSFFSTFHILVFLSQHYLEFLNQHDRLHGKAR